MKPFLTKEIDDVQKYDCEKKICKKFYGYKHRQLWCEVCTQISKTRKPYVVCWARITENLEKTLESLQNTKKCYETVYFDVSCSL